MSHRDVRAEDISTLPGTPARAAALPAAPPAGNRERVLARVRERPGIGPTAVADALGLSLPTVLYHVRRLEKAGQIEVAKVGKTLHCYPSGLARDTRALLPHLAPAAARRTALNVLHHPFHPTRMRADQLGLTRQAVQKQLKKLATLGLIQRVRDAHGRPGWVVMDRVGQLLVAAGPADAEPQARRREGAP